MLRARITPRIKDSDFAVRLSPSSQLIFDSLAPGDHVHFLFGVGRDAVPLVDPDPESYFSMFTVRSTKYSAIQCLASSRQN
jgi:hypothetical protein